MREETRKKLNQIRELANKAIKQEEYKEKYFIVREGMVKLTGGMIKAILLSSLIGWTEHWLRSDNEVYKLIENAAQHDDIITMMRLEKQIRQGWFWKSFTEMSKDLLGEISKSTCQRYISEFEEKGYIESRPAEDKAIYRANWYRANIDKIKKDLNELGYELDFYKNKRYVENNTVDNPSYQQGSSQDDDISSQNGTSHKTGIMDSESGYEQDTGENVQENSTSQNGNPPTHTGNHLLYSSFTSFRNIIYNELVSKNSDLLNLAKEHGKNIESCLCGIYLETKHNNYSIDEVILILEMEIVKKSDFESYNWVDQDIV